MAEYIDIDQYIEEQAKIFNQNGGYLGMTNVINFLLSCGIDPIIGLDMILTRIIKLKTSKYSDSNNPDDSDDEIAISDDDNESINSCDDQRSSLDVDMSD